MSEKITALTPIPKIPYPRTAPCAISCRGDGDQILALIGSNVQDGVCGFGDTLPDALRDLAKELEAEVAYDSGGTNPQARSFLRITRIENIWGMENADGTYGLRLDCGDGGFLSLTKDQATQIIACLSSFSGMDDQDARIEGLENEHRNLQNVLLDKITELETEHARAMKQAARLLRKREIAGRLITSLKKRLFAALDVEKALRIGLWAVDQEPTISRSILSDVLDCASVQHARANKAEARVAGLERERDTPETGDFFKGVPLEAAHQRARWGSEHDSGKSPADWFWLVGYLAGKCLAAHVAGDSEKALHHTISTAAALANWHMAIKDAGNMRPGIEEPKSAAATEMERAA